MTTLRPAADDSAPGRQSPSSASVDIVSPLAAESVSVLLELFILLLHSFGIFLATKEWFVMSVILHMDELTILNLPPSSWCGAVAYYI